MTSSKNTFHILSLLALGLTLNSCLISPGGLANLPGSLVSPAASAVPTTQPAPSPSAQPTVKPTALPTPSPSALPNPTASMDPDTKIVGDWDIRDAKDAGASHWFLNQGVLIQDSNTFRGSDEYANFEGTNALYRPAQNLADFKLSVLIKPTDDDGFGVIFRYQDEDNYYRLLSVQDSGNQGPFTRLQVKSGGVFKTLAEDAVPLHTETLPVPVSIEAMGNQLTVNVAGKKRFAVTDSRFATGRVGLMTYACSAEFSQFTVARY